MATNDNDAVFFYGTVQNITLTLVNPYSSKSYYIDGEYNVNSDSYDGLDGNDIMMMTSLGDYISLTDAADTQILKNVETFAASAGNDIINLAHSTILYGNVLISGSLGDDILWSNAGNDTIAGNNGDDIIDGGPGDDIIDGGANNDIVDGGAGNDIVRGGAGNDVLEGGAGADTLDGGTGDDNVIFSGHRSGYVFEQNSQGQLTVRDINTADGDDGTDILTNIEFVSFANGDYKLNYQAGGEFRVNTANYDNQSFSSITALVDGGFVTSWQSNSQDGSDYGIYAQRYDAQGIPQGSEFRVNTYTASYQTDPSITALSDGGFLVSWASYNQDGNSNGVYAQRYIANGAAIGSEFRVNTYTINQQAEPSVTVLKDGGFVINWTSNNQDGSWGGIYAQRYNASASPQGTEFRVNTQTINDQSNSGIAALSNGGFVVTWVSASGQDGSGNGIYAQRYNASAVPQGTEFRVNTYTTNNQSNPAITALSDGDFVITWESWGQGGSGESGIYAQRYDANGQPQGGEFQINNNLIYRQDNPSIAALKNGGFVVAWAFRDETDLDNAYYDIHAQRFDANGIKQGEEFLVNVNTVNEQYNPSITSLVDGGFVISWDSYDQDGSYSGIYARRYDANGNPVQAIIDLIPLSAAPTGSPTAILINGTEDNAYIVNEIDLLAGFSAGSDPLAVANLNADHGTVSNNGNGTFTITVAANYNGLVTLNYDVVNTNSGDSIAAVQSFTLDAVNDAPGFVAGANQVVSEDAGAQTISGWASGLSTGPADEAGQTLSFIVENDNAALFAVAPGVDANGTLSYTPAADAHGTAQVTVQIKDSGGTANGGIDTGASQSFTITIDAVNDDPTAIGLSNNHVDENSAIGTAIGTLVTTDVDNSTGFSYQLVSGSGDADNASFAIADDKLLLNAATDFESKSSYSIRIQTTDAGGLSHEETFTIHVDNVNDAPNAQPDDAPVVAVEAGGAGNATAGSDIAIAAAGVLANDSNGGDLNDPLKVTEVSFYDGTDTQTVNAGVALSGLYGTLILNADGSYSYAVDNDHAAVQGLRTGSDTLTETFQYTMRDQNGTGLASASTLTVTIEGANDAPVAHADGGNAREAGIVVGQDASGNVLLNDADVDNGDSKTVADAGVFAGAYGTLTLQANGAYSYAVDNTNPQVDALNVGGSLQDSFNYTVTDAQGATSTAQLNITIAGGNDAPVVGTDTVDTDQDSVIAIDVLTNDSDVDSGNLTVTLPTNTSTGGAAIAVNANQTVQYNPGDMFDSLALGDHASDSFGYTVHDNHPTEPGTSNGTVNLNIAGLNDAPQAQADTALTTENAAVTIDVLQNDDDADNSNSNSKTLVSVNVVNPANQGGSASIDGNQVVWSPNLDFDHLKQGEQAQVTLSYVMQDSHNAASAASVTITVQGSNDAPQGALSGSLANGQEDQSYWISEAVLLAGFSDAENDTLTVQNPATDHGTLSAGIGGWTFTPDSNYHGAVTLIYTVSDGEGGVTDTVTRTFNLTPVNDDPAAVADTLTTDEDQATTLDVVANDDDIDGDTLNVFSVTQGAHGAVTFAGGAVTYTPHQNYHGTDSFSYMVSDGQGGTDTEIVQVTVNSINDAPVAQADSGVIDEDGVLHQLAPAVLGNDSDIETDTLTADLVFGPQHGSLALQADGSYSYIPDADYNGSDSFSYRAFDGQDYSEAVTVDLTIAAVNDAPRGIALDNAHIDENTYGVVVGNLSVSDVDDTAHVLSVDDPRFEIVNQQLRLKSDAIVNFESESGISLNITATDSGNLSKIENFVVSVNDLNDAPVAMGVFLPLFGDEDNPIVGIVDAMDEDGDDLSYSVVDQPLHGLVTVNADGSFSYTPEPNFNGMDSFTYKVNDGQVDSNVAMVELFINAVNDTPIGDATGTLADGTEDIVYPVLAATLLQGFTDADGDLLSVVNPISAEGVLNPITDGWSFTPNPDYNGLVTLVYQVSDGLGGIVENITRTFNLTPVNDAPVGSPSGVLANGEEDKVYTLLQNDLLAGFSDADNDTLSVTGLTINHGTLSAFNSATNSWTFDPDDNYNGVINLSYGITDGKGGNISGIDRSFLLDPVNDTPSAGDDSGTVYEDATVTVNFDTLMANDIDVDGTAKTIVAVDTTGTAGNVVIDTMNRTVSYSADADEFDLLINGNTTVDSFKYILQSSSGVTTTATVAISVLGVSDGNLNLLGTTKPDNLVGTAGEDRIKGDNGNDIIDGGEGADDLFGENGDDVLNGGNSIDNLFGGNGNDVLNGGNGNDWLAGEKGDDVLTGGWGSDVFLFAKSGGNDVITDFADGLDKIQVSADTGKTGFGQLKIVGGAINGIVYSTIDMGNGGQVTLTGVATTQLDAADFIFPV